MNTLSEMNFNTQPKIRILIVGAGVVGLASGKGFAAKGHLVQYVDICQERISQLNKAGFNAKLAHEIDWGEIDIVMLNVSTPTVNGRSVLTHIESASRDVGHGLATTDKFITVVVRSTVPPTTTEKRLTPIIEAASGKTAGIGFGIAMNPEFLRQKTSAQDFARPWITVIGSNDHHATEMLQNLYKPFGGLITHCTPTEAEMAKYVNNIYNAVKISYFNEVHNICNQLEIDSNIVASIAARSAEGMWNPLYGIRGGVPYGGACLPKDTEAFQHVCNENDWEHLMLQTTIEVNNQLSNKVPQAESPEQIDSILAASNKTKPKISQSVNGVPHL